MDLPDAIKRLVWPDPKGGDSETRPADRQRDRATTGGTRPDAYGWSVRPHTRTSSVVVRWAGRAALAVVLLLGLIELAQPIRRLVHDPAPQAAPAAGMDLAAAASLAERYAADYWSYDADNPGAREAMLATYSNGSATTVPAMEGPGSLRADLVTAGAVASAGTDVAVVQTTARVRPAASSGLRPEERAEETSLPYAADPGPLDYPGRAMWLTLDVVVHDADTGLRVSGAALSGDSPTVIRRPSSEVDGSLTGQTAREGLPEEVFTAIAESDLRYLTTPDVQLRGLSGAVQLESTAGWSVATDRADTGNRYASLDVTWLLAGTQLAIPQSYALSMTETDGRWLFGAVGPVIEEQ